MTAFRRVVRRRVRVLSRRRGQIRDVVPAPEMIAPLLTAHTNADPCPRVEIVITHMPPTVDEVTVYRSWAGQRTVVRGAARAEVAGAFLVVDYEVPLGTLVTYSAVGYDANGIPTQESPSASVTVDAEDAWIQDPLDPASAMRAGLKIPRDLMVVAPSFLPGVYVLPSAQAQIVGSPLAVGLSGTRQSITRMPLTLDATNSTTSAELSELLDQASPLCVRTPVPLVPHLKGLVYLLIVDYTPEPDAGWTGATTYSLTADSVLGPGASIVIQPRTYDDLLAEASTYTDLMALYPTYLDVLRGP